ncbi:centriole, cilia and spindle-associated protein [Hippocampus comes]|uniref:centriole, cilia and spindle-associated protein n=1 Tax=Hippocampus comes TaxID=109280 RepID=UPI00094F2913|nr:PREDICTED: centriole, cilia and spindle-associated protein-like [Hippocampus comes]
MVTKKVRTEYMKKFREPKWETFSKCYEDSLKYRLTRRVMEHSHKPWFWEGWGGGSVRSSGKSTPGTAAGPRLGRNRVAPPVWENATGGGAAPPNASVASHEPDADDGPDADGDPVESAASPLRHRDGRPGNGSPTDRKPPPGGAGDEAAAPNDQHRRRARSADPDELRRRRLTASAAAAADDERWVTEYMRCFSARVDARPRL